MKIYWNGKTKNIIGPKVKQLRKQKKLSQRDLAAHLQTMGADFNDLTILRIEQQSRFVSDIELYQLAKYFQVTCDYLFEPPNF